MVYAFPYSPPSPSPPSSLSNYTPTTAPHTLSLHDALPILAYFRCHSPHPVPLGTLVTVAGRRWTRSEEHTSELQSRFDLVCRLLLEKKNYLVSEEGFGHDVYSCLIGR